MNVNLPCLNISRFVLETSSPLSIASGRSSMRFDTSIVRDANGLPTIPGPSLAGVLRHLYASSHGSENNLFGMAEGVDGLLSRLHVSWGCVHDSVDQPVEGLLLDKSGEERLSDALLIELLAEAPVLRRRVRINDRGVSDANERGLFDRSAVPAGARFSFEITLYSEDANDPEWEKVRGLFSHPGLRLGGATHGGLGDVRCVRWHEKSFDLREPDQYQAYVALPVLMGVVTGMDSKDVGKDRMAKGWEYRSIRLQPEAGWRIGGTALTPLGNEGQKAPDDVPHHEMVIRWIHDKASIHPRIAVATASSVKGALAHRIAFHANRLAGRWAFSEDKEKQAVTGEDCPEVVSLFGRAKISRDKNGNGEKGQAGKIFIEDAYLIADPPKVHWQMHTSLDRFTGGVRNKVLFGEEVIWDESFDLNIWINTKGLDKVSKDAWDLAVKDLMTGHLSLGGGVAHGHGWFTGEEVSHAG